MGSCTTPDDHTPDPTPHPTPDRPDQPVPDHVLHDDAVRTSAEVRRTAHELRGEATELRAGMQDGLARAARQTGERLIALSAATRDPSATVRRGGEWLTRAQEHTTAAARLRAGPRPPGH